MIAVCLKWVDHRPDVDTRPDTLVLPDTRFAGVSAADEAALEWALRCRDASGEELLVVTAGPVGAERILRDALAAGATKAVRVDVPFDAPSAVVAAGLAETLSDARYVWCGDYSSDRGSGSVPAYLAAALDRGQALGLVGVDLRSGTTESTVATRRLDGGRREVLRIIGPTVLSVEGSTARLRRAPLRAMLAATTIEVCEPRSGTSVGASGEGVSRPYRPRARALPAPVGATALERVRVLTASAQAVVRGDTVTLDPRDAAERIMQTLREWGYVD